MKHIKSDAMTILAEICMEENDSDVVQSFKDIKEIDDLLGIVKAKSLINHSKGRKSNREKRFEDVFRARIAAGAEDRKNSLVLGRRYLLQMVGYQSLVTVVEYSGGGLYKVLSGNEYRTARKEDLLPWCGEKY